MDSSTIDARGAEILRLLEQGVELDRAARLFLAEKYGCSESAIAADIERCQSRRVALTTVKPTGVS
jgi:hypothetical protein